MAATQCELQVTRPKCLCIYPIEHQFTLAAVRVFEDVCKEHELVVPLFQHILLLVTHFQLGLQVQMHGRTSI
jgi:hypothetical protein